MCNIQLSEIIKSNSLFSDAGEDFYRQLVTAMSCADRVVVDMTGVSSLPSVFLNVSIGRLIDEMGLDEIKHRVSFVMITKQQAFRLKEYLTKYAVAVN